jgi:hypothetical protein
MPTAWRGAKTNNIKISTTVSMDMTGSLHRSRKLLLPLMF